MSWKVRVEVATEVGIEVVGVAGPPCFGFLQILHVHLGAANCVKYGFTPFGCLLTHAYLFHDPGLLCDNALFGVFLYFDYLIFR